MTDPASSGAAGAAAFKAVGGASAVAAGGAGLAAVVVKLMTPPRSPREWAVGLISTVVASIGGGAATIEHFGLQHWVAVSVGRGLEWCVWVVHGGLCTSADHAADAWRGRAGDLTH
jgi:hypothetical protein